MKKQQLAARIWKSADQMRSKIDAGEYKDYILGFIFYKYLSEREVEFLKANAWDDEDISELSEDDLKSVEWIQNNLGYFIAYENLYDTWIDKGADFDVSDVSDGLSAFERNIADASRHVFKGIFKTLSLGLSKLGDSTQHQTKAIHDLLILIRPIPMGQKVDYDVLGFIYEYLINMFAANAGKKAGEFYTPHAVSQLMADIVADHLTGRESISVYDCAAGSASLLLTIGDAVAKRNGNPGKIKYYAQELKQNTYNLCRMNLVMRGIPSSNIEVKNADTLVDDWPLAANEFDPLRVDACCLNPPYSQKWLPPKEVDGRFSYGAAPKSKADYAFLEHSLYHMMPGGIMCIVLPHGVLFRGGEEETIRRNLLDRGHISAIIGLPANIFYGTGIPTIVMVLKKDAVADKSVLFIDGSHGYLKIGKKNELRAEDIRRVFDVYKARKDVPGFAHLAPFEEIEGNGFNLNIPRYVDSSKPVEKVDIFASMFGGIPSSEIDSLSGYWEAWPTLRARLFCESDGYAPGCAEPLEAVESDGSVLAWRATFDESLTDWPTFLEDKLLSNPEACDLHALADELADDLLSRMKNVPLVDRYSAYQDLAETWEVISGDIEAIQADGFHMAVTAVDPNMVESTNDKKNGVDMVQDKKEPWLGRVLPFALVQSILMPDELAETEAAKARVADIESELAEIPGNISEQEVRESVTKESDEELDASACAAYVKENLGIEIPEIDALRDYICYLKEKPGKAALLAYVGEHQGIDWTMIDAAKNGTYSQRAANDRIKELIASAESILPDESDMMLIVRACKLFDKRKSAKKADKELAAKLIEDTKLRIEGVTDKEALSVLHAKWVDSLVERVVSQREDVLAEFEKKVEKLSRKYKTTMADIDKEIESTSHELVDLLGQLNGGEKDMAGIAEFIEILGGE